MRILQIIDSLEAGGAERMAVNFANALAEPCAFSGLVSSRQEGSLKAYIKPRVWYSHLNKKRTLDLQAVFKLRRICIDHKVDYLHAHSSSYFLAMLVKFTYPRLKIIWHDHNGMSEFLNSRESVVLKVASYFFAGIIVVNNQLKGWAASELHCKQVIYLPNFTDRADSQVSVTQLAGTSGKQILCLANLRLQKNHPMLLEVAAMLKETHPQWTFHLVGKDFEDDYSAEVRRQVKEKKLDRHVYIYGSQNDTSAIIEQAEIAILTSSSEGLPVALLEYGLSKKPVVVTAVGEVPMIIKDGEDGFMTKPEDPVAFYNALVKLIEDPDTRSRFAVSLYHTIMRNNSRSTVISQYLNWIENL